VFQAGQLGTVDRAQRLLRAGPRGSVTLAVVPRAAATRAFVRASRGYVDFQGMGEPCFGIPTVTLSPTKRLPDNKPLLIDRD
jgi:hypothetical protein